MSYIQFLLHPLFDFAPPFLKKKSISSLIFQNSLFNFILVVIFLFRHTYLFILFKIGVDLDRIACIDQKKVLNHSTTLLISGGARNFIEPGQKKYRKTLLPSCE